MHISPPCLEQRRLEEPHVLVPAEQSRDLVGHEVNHLHPQHGAVDQEMPTLIENRILSVQRVRSLVGPYVIERRSKAG